MLCYFPQLVSEADHRGNCWWLQIGSLTLRKLRDLEKESGMTGGSKEGAKKKAPADEVRTIFRILHQNYAEISLL